jgi:hypothetical protein
MLFCLYFRMQKKKATNNYLPLLTCCRMDEVVGTDR